MHNAALAVLLAAACMSGCAPYPIYKTLQPPAHITVLDGASQPLPKAEATLVSNAYPYGGEKGRQTKQTAANGTAAFDAVREWRVETLMIHGAEEYFWNWCVRKDGYATYFTGGGSAREFQENLVIRLERGDSSPCPKNPR